MSKAAILTSEEAQHKARAEQYLAETERILRNLAAERRRDEQRHAPRPSIVQQVKAILQGA